MADESKVALPQATPVGNPSPTPEGVKMEGVKSIIGNVDTESVTGTGALYVQMANRLTTHAENIVAHAGALANVWRGPNAEKSLQVFSQLHTATTGISTNVADVGETYKWLGTTILPFYKDSAQSMTDGFVRTDGDDDNARQLLDRMNARVAEANNGLPSRLTVIFPEVGDVGDPGNNLPSGPSRPSGPGGYVPQIPPGDGSTGSWIPGYDNGGLYTDGSLYENVQDGTKNPGLIGEPNGSNGPWGGPNPSGNSGIPGNGTDLASSQPSYPGPNQNPFNLNPTGPNPGLPTQPGPVPQGPTGSGPFMRPPGGPSLSTPGGPNSLASRTLGAPRTTLSQSPGQVPGQHGNVIGGSQQAGARGGSPMGGGSRGGGNGSNGGEDHTRTTWLSEDRDVWGSDSDVPPSVIG